MQQKLTETVGRILSVNVSCTADNLLFWASVVPICRRNAYILVNSVVLKDGAKTKKNKRVKQQQ